MINLSTNKQLGVTLANTNRALAVVLKEATPKEMETILKDKDLKSVINSMLKGSIQNSESDKALLNLAKNNPTLKDLGNVSNTVKELLNVLKSEKNPLPIESALKKFLVDIKELSEPLLKQKLENSGVFLESRLKNAQNPQVELKNILISLKKSIEKSEIPSVKLLAQNIKEMLATPTLKEASNSALLQAPKNEKAVLALLAKDVENIVSKLSEQLKSADIITTKGFEKQLSKADPLFSKETAALIPKLSHFSAVQKLSADESVKEILSQDLKAVLLKAGEEMAKSPHPNQAEILKHVDKLLLQIDYFQMLSHLSNSSSLYLPFSWDSLEEGSINIKKDKNSVFYCDIDLKLKEYGELKLKLALYEENQINIHIYSDSSEFKEIVKESIASLRSALIESQITPREIRIFDTPKKSPISSYETPPQEIDMGFEVKV
ncbi:flagellar hook-length control protein FliK [Sulfurimonas sp.]|uniref:flagellar hook-length control protein FliK n=1 Tax=Sulfurimonas sp. TaxID=2022749 RepID=UPI0025E16085|nr:flagellar hook-length control protein FliK [Sulfurimonas sp.]MBW6488306.1 flagellar hook-length control protein FliK [Sulfurimonas sp.]